MSKRSQSVSTSQEYASDSEDIQMMREPHIKRHTASLPSAALDVGAGAPHSETGVAAAVVVSADGKDNDDRQDAPLAVGEAHPATAVSARPVVLLVEDTHEIAEVIVAVLSRVKIETVHESHGARALDRFNTMKPDVILLDIGLPDISGWQFLENLKAHTQATGRGIPPVIVISAFGDPANRLVGKFQGVHDYLIKPFTAAEVEQVVTKALATRGE
ncbi:MAG: response regulator [Anaerolineae bacterium]|nr:response regulator [Anaerolineae bacterium]